MLTAKLPVCHFPGMPGQNSGSNTVSGSNSNLNLPNDISGSNTSNSSNLNSNNVSGSCNLGVVGGGVTTVATKNQLEQLNTMREALFSQDGWGCQHVNQDTNWEVPNSPEPTIKDPSAPPLWKPNVNNGTELWESTLRNGGQPPAQSVQKTPWGHTPSSNLGGTWGEDDDGVDTNSVWTGSNSNTVVGAVNTNVHQTGSVGTSGNATGGQWTPGGSGIVSGNQSVGSSGSALPPNITPGNGANLQGPNNVSGSATSGPTWGDPRDLRSNATVDLRNVDPRDQMRAPSAGDPRDIRLVDPRDPIRGDPRGISGRLNGSSEMWGQHHAMTHSQMSGMNKIVGQATTPTVVQNSSVPIGPGVAGLNSSNSNQGPGTPQWGNSQSVVITKDISNISVKNISGWEEPSPPTQRRNLPNYDDGTALWGQQQRLPNTGNHWKDIPDTLNRSHLLRNTINNSNSQNVNLGPGIPVGANSGALGNTNVTGISGVCVSGNNSIAAGVPQSRIGPVTVGPGTVVSHKQEGGLWVPSSNLNNRNNSSWDDGNHNIGNSSNWSDEKANASVPQIGTNLNSWNDATTWGKTATKVSGAVPGWTAGNSSETTDITNEWNSHTTITNKPPPKLPNAALTGINSDLIKQSKQFRYLIENGFKKEDAERALLAANMNLDEAAEFLRSNAFDNWRRHEDVMNSFEHNSSSTGVPFPNRFNSANIQSGLSYSQGNILNNMSSGAVHSSANNLTTLNSLQVQKFLNQSSHNIAGSQASMNNTGNPFPQASGNLQPNQLNISGPGNNIPSSQQLRMLVQQIQMAVHNGYLSSQILNQPLAPTTLVLLNQLLSSIKHLQAAQQSLVRSNTSNNLPMNVAIAKHKQQIQNLQNQINTQQALYIKQQQSLQQQNTSSHSASTHLPNPDYLRGPNEAINNLQSNFSEIALNKPSNNFQGSSNQQSRLNQWKLPALDKDENSEFSRAPGTTKQNMTVNNSGNISHLGLPSEGTWSSNRNLGDGWPDVTNDCENKDWSVAATASATSYSDLVQEFEPGKPWKGSQIKSIEDDPSMTPGSVVRSPLSINAASKETDIFATASKSSPSEIASLGLGGSSTWSFNPPSNTFSSWSETTQQCTSSELWGNQLNKSSRGPPPGLGSNKNTALVSTSTSSGAHTSVGSVSNSNWIVGNNRGISGSWSTNSSTWNSSWLLLKNLTSQIDGSTLRTLCMQHGQPVSFHLYLNQGFALCKYATHEEASKAQMTLNNCVLSNTTICAESPSESEVQNIMKHLPQNSNSVPNVAPVTNCGNNTCNGNSTNTAANNNSSSNVSTSSNNCSNTLSVGGSFVGVNSSNTPSNSSTISNNINSSQVTMSNSSGGPINSNSNSISSNHNNWRQNSQNQSQSQNRAAGREADFDYISKYVCSIVDD